MELRYDLDLMLFHTMCLKLQENAEPKKPTGGAFSATLGARLQRRVGYPTWKHFVRLVRERTDFILVARVQFANSHCQCPARPVLPEGQTRVAIETLADAKEVGSSSDSKDDLGRTLRGGARSVSGCSPSDLRLPIVVCRYTKME